MFLKTKYNKFKFEVDLLEKKRNYLRNSKSWLRIRDLKKKKLAIKDILIFKDN